MTTTYQNSNEIKRLLSGFGAEIFQALRIDYAKEHLTKFKTGDIVICDFKLADGNVIELITRVRDNKCYKKVEPTA